MTPGEFTRQEILSQPEVWQATLESFPSQASSLAGQAAGLRRRPFLVTGCGSTYYLSVAAAAVLHRYGLQAIALPASELVYYSPPPTLETPVLLAISRSGTTSETIWAVEAFRRRYPQGLVIAISTVPATPVVEMADFRLLAAQAQERSVAQTRSFTSMYLLAQALASTLAGDQAAVAALDRLPGALVALFERESGLPRRLGEDLSLERFFFLGGGPLYGLACEAMLKTKELTCSWAEAYHPLEFRHGPMSVAGPGSLVVSFLSSSAAGAEAAVLGDMQQLGSRTLALAEQSGALDNIGTEGLLSLDSGLDDWGRGPLYLPLLQLAAYHRALAKGLDPDHPRNLTMVVEL